MLEASNAVPYSQAGWGAAYRGNIGGRDVRFAITGIGMVNMALGTYATLQAERPTRAVNIGIGGSLGLRELPIGTVVQITEESFADLGRENAEGFEDLKQMGFALFSGADKEIFNDVTNDYLLEIIDAQRVRGFSVNTVTGKEQTVDSLLNRYGSGVESMEGAAFFLVCKRLGQAFAAFRALSNRVGPRATAEWDIPLAIQKLNDFVLEKLKTKEL